MYGLHAISANNGWAITFVGISIVFTGLVFLALMISQIHKILNIWEDRAAVLASFKKVRLLPREPAAVSHMSFEERGLREVIDQYRLLTNSIGNEPFSLPQVLQMAVNRGLAKPFSTINRLLEKKIIVSDGKGFYHWNEAACKKLHDK